MIGISITFELLQKMPPIQPLQLCTELADKHDTLRSEYWQYTTRSLQSKFGADICGDDGDDGDS